MCTHPQLGETDIAGGAIVGEGGQRIPATRLPSFSMTLAGGHSGSFWDGHGRAACTMHDADKALRTGVAMPALEDAQFAFRDDCRLQIQVILGRPLDI